MTREEVVKWLESLKRETGKAENRTLWHYAESIDMAIKELSAEAVPQSDQYKKGFEDAKRAFLLEYARESETMRKRNAQFEVMLNAQKAISAEAKTSQNLTKPYKSCEVDLISRQDAIDAIRKCDFGSIMPSYWHQGLLQARHIIEELPSADADNDDLIIKGAKGIQDGLYNIKDGKLFKYKAKGGTVQAYEIVPSAESAQGWIPFTRKPMTEEEQKDYPNCTFMFDCVLPDDGDEILVSNGRFVWMDTFCNDIDGCYLDSGDDIDEDMAWMPLPKPYKGGDDE